MPSEVRLVERNFHTCDRCGKTTETQVGELADGYYIGDLLSVNQQRTIATTAYACSARCIPEAISQALYRETLSEEDRKSALEELERNYKPEERAAPTPFKRDPLSDPLYFGSGQISSAKLGNTQTSDNAFEEKKS